MKGFKIFLESNGYINIDGRRDFMGFTHEMPDIALEFPTKTTTGTIISDPEKIGGDKYKIYVTGGTTIIIESEKYKKLQEKIGKKLEQGDTILATWYAYKDRNQKNYSLQSISLVKSR